MPRRWHKCSHLVARSHLGWDKETKMEDISALALEALRIRITMVLPAQIRSCIDELNEEQLWWRPNNKSNSVGNLVLHVRGALLHYLCRNIGGIAYQRNRPAEFDSTSSMSKSELVAAFADVVEKSAQTFAALETSHLTQPSTEPAYYSTVFEDLFGIAVHLATHTGQIMYVTKMLKEGSLNDLWMQTHRASGAWNS